MNGKRIIPALLSIVLATVATVGDAHAGPREGAAAGGRNGDGTARVVARATLAIATDGGGANIIEIDGLATDEGIRFAGSRHDPARNVTVTWNWLADLDPRGKARLAGDASVLNHATEKREFDVRVAMPLNPLVTEASRIGGRVRVTLAMDDDGGRLEVPFGQSVWTAMVDDEPGKTLHNGPFAMGGTGAGNAVTDASFGAPYPAFEAASVEDGFGIRHRFRLTGGDKATFESELLLTGDEENFIRRRPDGPIRIAPGDDRVVIQVDGRQRRATTIRRSGRAPAAARPRELKITPSRR